PGVLQRSFLRGLRRRSCYVLILIVGQKTRLFAFARMGRLGFARMGRLGPGVAGAGKAMVFQPHLPNSSPPIS
ncbi:MAG: hypothetical protein KUG70_07235, partial [Rhodobacteraceae bacterium]|nr:hypothetical protein [Paracoccaceae bacterium]